MADKKSPFIHSPVIWLPIHVFT